MSLAPALGGSMAESVFQPQDSDANVPSWLLYPSFRALSDGIWGTEGRISGSESGNVSGVSLRPMVQWARDRNVFFYDSTCSLSEALLAEGKQERGVVQI